MFFSSSDSLNVVREISNVGRKDYKGSILFLVPYTKITSRVFSPVFCCFHSDAFSIHVLRNLDYISFHRGLLAVIFHLRVACENWAIIILFHRVLVEDYVECDSSNSS